MPASNTTENAPGRNKRILNRDVINKMRDAAIRRNVIWGMVINIVLTALKLFVGISVKSRALISDAIHSFSDLFTDVIILVGARYWSRPPDAEHPYGHRRIETFVTVIVGSVLALAAVMLGGEAFNALRHPGGSPPSPPGWAAFWVAIVSVVVKEALYQWTAAVGRKTRSLALQANAWHHRSDALSSIPVALAIAGSRLFPALAFLDSVGAIIVAFMLLHVAYRIMRPAIGELMEIGAPPALARSIASTARGVPGVLNIHSIRTRYSGARLMVDMHVMVDPDLPVREGHAISSRICDAIHRHSSETLEVLIHIEPFDAGKAAARAKRNPPPL
jgi:cation diffusion facilitator family transporter